jgi:cytidylate kinase
MSEGRAGIAIAVDGPAASGKGTAARALARALGYAFIDTGAMYRAVALVARRAGVSWDAEAELGRLAQDLDFAWRWDGEGLRLSVRGEDVTEALRDGEIGTGASRVSRHPAVRAALLEAQRAAARRGGVVMDGRDIGTVVLPDAELTARAQGARR